MVQSFSSSNPKEFSGILVEALRNLIIRQEGVHVTEEDGDNIFPEPLRNDWNAGKLFLTKTETVSLAMFEASQRHVAKMWQDTINLELEEQKFKAHEVEWIPTEHQGISTRFAHTKHVSEKTIFDRYKARLVVGHLELKTNFGGTFAPSPHLDTLRFVIFYSALMFRSEFLLHSIDLVSAF